MKQPGPGTCVPTSLAVLSGRDVDEILSMMRRYIVPPRLEKDGWNDAELVYTAHRLGMLLCPFIQEVGGYVYDEFLSVYEFYDGILLGMLKDQTVGHAVAKKDGWIIDPTWGTRSEQYGHPYQRLTQRVYFAWMKN